LAEIDRLGGVMPRPLFTFLFTISALFHALVVRADIHLPAIFSDHAVLMKSPSVPVWGKADPGEAVTVSLAGEAAHAVTSQDGRWRVSLNLQQVASGPFELIVTGKNEVRLTDVVVGAVWLAAGQSNMERLLKVTAGAADEVAGSDMPLLRQFRVEKAAKPAPADDCTGQWTLAVPATVGEFTAVGYYFGKQLHRSLQRPVGIINASWGGTFSEAWTSMEAINSVDELKDGEAARRAMSANFLPAKQRYVIDYTAWLKTHAREDKPCADVAVFASELAQLADWAPIAMPGKLPGNGALWLRKDIDVPQSALQPGLDFKIMLGRMEGFERVYWNGALVSETTIAKLPGSNYPRYFQIPHERLKLGRNVLAVRIYAPAQPVTLSVNPLEFKAGPVVLTGAWLVKSEYSFDALSEASLAAVPQAPLQPPGLMAGAIFNGIIAPIIPFALDGIIWYQGESNTGRAWQHRIAFPLLIEDWRRQWRRGDLPFYFCQLANYLPKRTTPGESEWAELRDAQSAALHLPKTGQAVLIDLGESGDIHPRNKKDVGARLGRLALANDYGQSIVTTGPTFEASKIEAGTLRIQFAHIEGGLVAKPLPEKYDVSTLTDKSAMLIRNSPASQLEGFSICGEDHRWVWANAKIDGDTVVVSSDQVPVPIAVRYAWADNPTCNLYNSADLPAVPFRTDDFPAMTAKKLFGPGS
jgi:sialate O-acetylesterase